jgi:uncharacterized protein YeaO (DUF488 family)
MLKQASVSDLVSDKASRDTSYVVITMRRYPRFVSRELRDEYVSCMSPSPKLHEAWLSAKRRHNDHDGAFARSRFEERFEFDEDGMRELERLAKLSKKRDVTFVCQCRVGRRCHRELLLILARELFGAKVQEPSHEYPRFIKRVPEFERQLGALLRPKQRRTERMHADTAPAR